MSRQNRCPIHPKKLLRRQQRTGVNEFHGYKVLHLTLLLSPDLPGGWEPFHQSVYDAIQRILAHLLETGLHLFTELSRGLPLIANFTTTAPAYGNRNE